MPADTHLENLRRDPFKVCERLLALGPNIGRAVQEILRRDPGASGRDLTAAGQLYVLEHANDDVDIPLHSYLHKRLRRFLKEQARAAVTPLHVPRRRRATKTLSLAGYTEGKDTPLDKEVDRAFADQQAAAQDRAQAEVRAHAVQEAVATLDGEQRAAAEGVMAGESARELARKTGRSRRAVAELRDEAFDALRPKLAHLVTRC